MTDRHLDVGSAISQTFELYREHWKSLLGLAASVAVAQALLVALVKALAPTSVAIAVAVGLGASLVLGAILSGMLTFLVADIRDGRQDETLRQIYARTQAVLGPLLITVVIVLAILLPAVAVMIGATQVAGAVGLIVGLAIFVIAVFFAFVGPVVVLEGLSGAAALRRSAELVRGVFWPLLGLLVVVGLIAGVLNALVSSFADAFLPGAIGTSIAGAIAYTLTMPIQSMPPVLAYFQLVEQEGRGTPDPGMHGGDLGQARPEEWGGNGGYAPPH